MPIQDVLLLQGVTIEFLTPASAYLNTTRTAVIELKDSNNELKGLMTSGKTILRAGDIISVAKKDTIFSTGPDDNAITRLKIHSLRRVTNPALKPFAYEVVFFPQTLAMYFLLPLTGMKSNADIDFSCFINAYAGIDGKTDGNRYVHLLYRFNESLIEHEPVIKSTPGFYDTVEVHYDYCCYRFLIKESNSFAFSKFLQGKYSQIDEATKLRIMQFHGFKKGGYMHGILYRTESARTRLEESLTVRGSRVSLPESAELLSKCDIYEETIDTTLFHEISRAIPTE